MVVELEVLDIESTHTGHVLCGQLAMATGKDKNDALIVSKVERVWEFDEGFLVTVNGFDEESGRLFMLAKASPCDDPGCDVATFTASPPLHFSPASSKSTPAGPVSVNIC